MNLNSQDSPFFIVGCERSGTTLLRLMLNQHPRLRVPRESWFLIDLMNQLPLQTKLSQQDLQLAFRIISNHHKWKTWEVSDSQLWEVISALEQPRLCELIKAVFLGCGNLPNKPRWGDKTPIYVKEIDRLHQVFPTAKFVHIIRDSRDVTASLHRQRWGGGTLEKAARHWGEMVNAGTISGQRLGAALYFEFGYEDLVLHSEKTLNTICRFLGETYTPQMLTFHQHSLIEETHPLHVKTQRPPQSSDTYRWRQEMNAAEIAIVEAVAGKTMDRIDQTRHFRGLMRLLPFLFHCLFELSNSTRTFRQKLGLRVPYRILQKLGLA